MSNADLQAFLTALEAAFGNLQESGWNDWFTKQVAAQEASVLKTNVNAYVQSVVQNLEAQGINPTDAQIQAVENLLVSDLQTALNQIISTGVYAIEQQLLIQLSGAATNEIKPDNAHWAELLEGTFAGIGLACAAFGLEGPALVFGTISFGLWAFNEDGLFD